MFCLLFTNELRVTLERLNCANHSFTASAKVSSLTLETITGQQLAEPGREFVLKFFNDLAEACEPYSREQ